MARTDPRPHVSLLFKGAGNPNFKGGPWPHKCLFCGIDYITPILRESKFCSKRCQCKGRGIFKIKITIPKIRIHKERKIAEKKPKKPPRIIPSRDCNYCGTPYSKYGKTRRFCSYKCHVESGNAREAAKAAVKSQLKKYGAKKDANHNEIVKALRKAGAFVKDISGVGWGAPDLIIWSGSSWELVEIKNLKTSYGRKGFSKSQKKWQEEWSGVKVHLIHSIDEALILWATLHKENKPPEIHKVSSVEEALAIVGSREVLDRMREAGL